MGAGVEQNKIAKVEPDNSGSVRSNSADRVVSSATVMLPANPDLSFTTFNVDPNSALVFSTDPAIKIAPTSTAPDPNTINQNVSPGTQPVTNDPKMPTVPDLSAQQFQLSPEAVALASGNLEGVTFSFSDALPASLFDNPDVWKYEGSVDFGFSTDFSFSKDYTWEFAKDSKFEGVRDMGYVVNNALGDKRKELNQNEIDIINGTFGSLFNVESQNTPTGTPVKDRPLETTTVELSQNVTDAVLNKEPFFHATSGENRGRAYRSRIENTLKLLQEGKLDLNDPEVKKMVVAIARQLYSEAALEPNQVLPFYEMLKIKEFGRDITPEQFEKLVNDMSPDQMKRLLDGSIDTLKERLKSPPKAWIMNKAGEITNQEMDTLRGEKGASPRQVLDVVKKVWTRDEILQSETRFYNQTGYHTSFYEETNGYTNYEAGIKAIEARADSSTGNSSYLSTLSASSQSSDEPYTYNKGIFGIFSNNVEDVLLASAALEQQEKDEKEHKKEQFENNPVSSWFTSPLVTTLALAGKPDEVIDTKFKTYVPVDQIAGDNPSGSVLLSSVIKLPKENDDNIG